MKADREKLEAVLRLIGVPMPHAADKQQRERWLVKQGWILEFEDNGGISGSVRWQWGKAPEWRTGTLNPLRPGWSYSWHTCCDLEEALYDTFKSIASRILEKTGCGFSGGGAPCLRCTLSKDDAPSGLTKCPTCHLYFCVVDLPGELLGRKQKKTCGLVEAITLYYKHTNRFEYYAGLWQTYLQAVPAPHSIKSYNKWKAAQNLSDAEWAIKLDLPCIEGS